MNYIKAKTEAQKLANIRQLPHVILFNGKDYHVAIQKRCKGNFFELVEPVQSNQEIVEQPAKQPKRVQKTKDIQ